MDENRYSLLYVEDEKDIRAGYVEFFKIYFKTIYEANSVKDALELYKIKKPEVMIVDINLNEEEDGLNLIKQIRDNDKDIKIVVLSGYSDQEMLFRAIELNLITYIVKPASTIKLDKIIRSIIFNIDSEIKLINISEFVQWDTKNKILLKNNQEIRLTKNELTLISLLSTNTKQTFNYETIYDALYDDTYEYSLNKLRIIISKLKSKLEEDIVESVYSLGYKLKTIKKEII